MGVGIVHLVELLHRCPHEPHRRLCVELELFASVELGFVAQFGIAVVVGLLVLVVVVGLLVLVVAFELRLELIAYFVGLCSLMELFVALYSLFEVFVALYSWLALFVELLALLFVNFPVGM
jgi:hypothetical protein